MDLEAVLRELAVLEAHDGPAVTPFVEIGRDEPLAVLPSAFNPPTFAHFALLRASAAATGARPAALLTTRNVAKGIEGADLEHRVGMLLAARREEAELAVLVANAARIVDQARALRSSFPDSSIDFVVGYDTLIRLFDTRYYDDMEGDLREMFEHHRLVAANRGEEGKESIERFLERHAATYAHRILSVELPEHEASLSSTIAREEPGERNRVVPRAVHDYIEREQLYRASPRAVEPLEQ